MNFFDYLNSLNNKTELEWTAEVEKDFAPFMVLRGLGYFPDTVLIANEMNRRSYLDKKMVYDFLYRVIPRGKRFSKWNKVEENDTVDLLIKVYGYSRRYAATLLDLLSEKDIEELKARINEGGRTR